MDPETDEVKVDELAVRAEVVERLKKVLKPLFDQELVELAASEEPLDILVVRLTTGLAERPSIVVIFMLNNAIVDSSDEFISTNHWRACRELYTKAGEVLANRAGLKDE